MKNPWRHLLSETDQTMHGIQYKVIIIHSSKRNPIVGRMDRIDHRKEMIFVK